MQTLNIPVIYFAEKARYIMQSVNLNRVCARYPVCSTGTLHRTMQRFTMTVLWPEKYVYWPLPHHLCLTSSKGCTQKRYIIMYLCSYRRSSPALQNFIKTSANQTIDFFSLSHFLRRRGRNCAFSRPCIQKSSHFSIIFW